MKSVEEALKARDLRKKKEKDDLISKTEEKQSKIDSALEAYKNRKKASATNKASELAQKIDAEIKAAKSVPEPSWNEDMNGFLDGIRQSRVNVQNLIQEVESYKGYFDKDTYGTFSGVLGQLNDSYAVLVKRAEALSRFASEDDYKKHVAEAEKAEADRKALLDYDQVAGQAEIDELQKIVDEIDDLQGAINATYSGVAVGARAYANEQERAVLEARMHELVAQCGGVSEIRAALSNKRAYHALASRAQKGVELASVVGNEDFLENSQYISTAFKPETFWDKFHFTEYNLGYDDLTHQYINGDEEFRAEVSRKHSNYNRNTMDGESRFEEANLDQMSEDEVKIYNYYYNTEGKEKAEEYLDSIQETLNYRKAQKTFGALEGKTFLEMVFGVEAGLDQFATGFESLFSSKDYIPASDTQIASGMVREDLADNGAKLPDWIGGASLGQVAYDSISTTANMLPSIMVSFVPVVGQAASVVTLGASAAGHAKAEMLNLGYSKRQANLYGAMVGASEAGLQYLLGGITRFGGKLPQGLTELAVSKVDNAIARVAITLGMNMASEGLEESLQTVIEPWLKSLVTGVDFEAPDIDEVLYSGLLGAVSSLLMEGGSTVYGEVAKKHEASAVYGENAADLVAEALEINPNDAYALKMKALLDEGKTLTGGQINRLIEGNEKSLRGQESAEIKTAAAESLTELGETGNIGTERINEKARNKEVYSFAEEVAGVEKNAAVAPQTFAPQTQTSSVTESAAQKENASEGKFEASADGKTRIGDTEVSIKEVASIKGGEMMLQLEDGSTVKASDVEFGSSDEALLYENVLDMGLNAASANAFLRGYDGKLSAEIYALGFREAYQYGEYGVPENELSQEGFLPDLTEVQRHLAYNLGKANADAKAEREDKALKDAIKKAAERAEADGTKATADKEGGVRFEAGVRPKTAAQKHTVRLAKHLAKALGIDIVFYDATLDGAKNTKDNGYYDPNDDSIHLDLQNARDDAKTIVFTLSHELVHFIKKWSPAKFKTFADFLMEQYAAHGISASELLLNKMASLGTTDSDFAYEELIADACERMLLDSDAVVKLMELRKADINLFEKIKLHVLEILEKLRAVFNGVDPNTREGVALQNMVDVLDQIHAMFEDAAVDAAKTYQEAQGARSEGLAIKRQAKTVKAGMSEAERYSILKDAKIVAITDLKSEAQPFYAEIEKIPEKAKGQVEQLIKDLADDLKIINVPLSTAALNIEFQLSKNNGLRESLSQQLKYGGNFHDFSKALINLRAILERAILIEAHTEDRYKGTEREDINFEAGYVLFSAFKSKEYIIPVKLEIKQKKDAHNVLYVVVSMTKIEGTSVMESAPDDTEVSTIPLSDTDSVYSLSHLVEKINPQDRKFLKYLPDQMLSNEQIAAKKLALKEDKAKLDAIPKKSDGAKREFSNGVKSQKKTVTNRTLLADALESTVKDEDERKRLTEYKEAITEIESAQEQLTEIRAKIKEMSFATGPRDTKAINALRFEANKLANRISVLDGWLLRLESMGAIKGVLAREKARAYEKAKQEGKEALAAYRERAEQKQKELAARYQESRKKGAEGRHKTEMRLKIKGVVNELNTLLLNPTAKKHIKEELRKGVAEALSAINMDTVGAEERLAVIHDKLAKTNDPYEIEHLLESYNRISLQGDKLKDKLDALQNAYEKIKASDDIELSMSYQEVIYNSIKNVSDKVGNTSIRNMTLEQLEMVYDLVSMIRQTVRNANKAFNEQKGQSIMQMAEAVNDQVRTVGGQTYKLNAISAALQKAGWTFLKPFVAFRTIGSATLTNLYKKLRNGEDTFYADVKDAQAFIEKQYKKHGYKSWDMKKTKTFTAKSGKTFELTLEQMMTLYAYSKREQAHKHIIDGGLVFEDAVIVEKKKAGIPIKYVVTTKKAFNLSEETFAEITNSLSAEQKAFVDEMQEYLSVIMGAKGNEVSMELLGVKLFKEKFYLPIKSSQEYMNFNGEEAGEIKLKSPAFSKETVAHANNPIVLHNFTDLWAEHINDMAMYHAFVLALEDFTRVYNYKTRTDTTVETVSVKATLDTAFPGATKYINKFLKDMNGGVRGETVGFAEKLASLAKKGMVLGSASVAIQQPSSVMRAMAYINPKHFVTTAHKSVNLVKHKQDWEEIKKYAPIAGIKEMGRFDVGMGQGTLDWVKSNKSVGNKIEDVFSAAPAFMDEVTWVTIWNAVKRETLHTHKNLRPNSEEFLEAVGERFTEVISLSQVYDSVFSRSELMRNKSWVAKALTAFMAEPSTTLNMIWDSWVQAKRQGSAKAYAMAIFTTGAPIVASIVLNSALKSIILAMRDDDEDESYAEKYLEHFVGDLKDNLNPLTLIPFVKDIVSIFRGYDVERMDMALFSDLNNAIEAFDSDSKTAYEKWSGLIGAISSFFGVPVKNVERDIRAFINTFFGKTEATTKAGLINAIEEGWTGKEKSNVQQLYEAMLDGDEKQIERVRGRFENQAAINVAIRKALRENDSRIKAAAQERVDGDISAYTKIVKEIVSEGRFSQDIVVGAVNAESDALKKASKQDESVDEEDTDKVSSIYKASDISVAFENGDSKLAVSIIDDLVKTKVANGMEESKAKASVKSSMTSYWKPLYVAAYKAGHESEMRRIRYILRDSGLYGTVNEAVKTCQAWVREG